MTHGTPLVESPFEHWLRDCMTRAQQVWARSIRRSMTFDQLDAEVRHQGGWPDLDDYLRGAR